MKWLTPVFASLLYGTVTSVETEIQLPKVGGDCHHPISAMLILI